MSPVGGARSGLMRRRRIPQYIQDKGFAWWKCKEGSGSTVVDELSGGHVGTITGATWVSDTWVESNALSGDGTDDYVDVGTLGTFGSNMSTNFAIAATVQASNLSTISVIMGVNNQVLQSTVLQFRLRGDQNGELEALLRDEGGNIISSITDSAIDDGTKKRVVLNKTANSASGLNLWINNSDVAQSSGSDESFSNPANFDNPLLFFARTTSSGDDTDHLDAILDDIILFSDSLTSSEITTDYNRQPWS